MITRDGLFLPIFQIKTRGDKRFSWDTDPLTEDRWFVYEFQPEELGWHPPYFVCYKYRWNIEHPNLIGTEGGPYGTESVQDALTLTIGWEDDLGVACTQDFGVKVWRNKATDASINASVQCRRRRFSQRDKVCANGTYELYMAFINKPYWMCRKCATTMFRSEYLNRQYNYDELYAEPEKLVLEGNGRLHHLGGLKRTPKPKRYEIDAEGNRIYLPGWEHTEAADIRDAERQAARKKRNQNPKNTPE